MNRLARIIRDDLDLMRLLEALCEAALPEWRIVSGCLYQTVWNVLTGRPRGTGIVDIDVIYFDAGDVSWEAEDAVIRRLAPLGPLQVRNQARVHLWYEQRFGTPYPALASADAALPRYPVMAQAVGARLQQDGRLDIAAPFGLDDVFAMVLRPNPMFPHPATFAAKARRARAIWPEIRVVETA